MNIDVITLFPDMFNGFLSESIIKRAIDRDFVKINIHNLRNYSNYSNKQVDDTPFGGGSGMVLMCEPIYNAIESLRKDNSLVIMLTPQGNTYNQSIAYNLAEKTHIILVCGHYEGFDERIRKIIDLEISIGDFVLTGGEVPSMIIIDSVVRLITGVINKKSIENESFNDNLLDYPTYTKPRVFRDMEVPSILLSGHHTNIEKWRYEQRIKRTRERRPDLLRGCLDE